MQRDRDFYSTMLKVEISDTIFKHHMNSQNIINIVLIFTQMIAMVVSIVATVRGVNISKYTAVYNLTVCMVVMLNIMVHNRTWKQAKDAQHNKIDKLIDIILLDKDKNEKQYELNRLLGLRTIYDKQEFWDFLDIKEADEELNNLKFNWISNARRNVSTGVKDANGVEYCTGDIVYNPSFGDYWLVEEISKKEMKEYGATISYILSLYGNPDEYAMCLDEPVGFTIEVRATDFAYVNMLSRFVKIYKSHREEEAELEKETQGGEIEDGETRSKEVNE